jgi:HNH endonuclease
MMETIKSPRKQRSKEFDVAVFRRDRWLCHLCKRPVIFAPAMKYLQEELKRAGYDKLTFWRYAYSRQFAPLLDELAAVVDHVKPHARDGPCDTENLKTACNKCNTRKSDADYAKWASQNPARKNRGKEPLTWDGLSSVFVFYATRDGRSLTPTEKEWLAALTKPSALGKP